MPKLDSTDFNLSIKELEERLKIKIQDVNRPVTPEEVQWMLDHSPYLQIVSANGGEPANMELVSGGLSNWSIINYGDAMSSSPGLFMFDRYSADHLDDDDGGDGGCLNPGRGTIINQAYLATRDMIALAKKLGWTGIHVVGCHRMMGRFAWIEAEKDGMSFSGFEPDATDQRIKKRLGMSMDTLRSYLSRGRQRQQQGQQPRSGVV